MPCAASKSFIIASLGPSTLDLFTVIEEITSDWSKSKLIIQVVDNVEQVSTVVGFRRRGMAIVVELVNHVKQVVTGIFLKRRWGSRFRRCFRSLLSLLRHRY